MTGIPIIAVSLTLVLVYLYLSLVASIVQEWIAQVLALRSSMLRSGIETLLAGSHVTGIAGKLLNHSLIKSISANKSGPSYIPGPIFTTALLDLVSPNQPGAPPNVFASVRYDIAAMQPGRARDALLALADSSGRDLAKFQANVAHWFDSAMDRVSGEYKRRARWILFFLGLTLAIVLNADTFSIARLSALGTIAAPTSQIIDQALLVNPNLTQKTAVIDAGKLIGDLGETVPLGWPKGGSVEELLDMKEREQGYWAWTEKIVGFLITALMVSLGASFWFNVLDSIRSVGPRPPDTGTEDS